MKSYSTLKRWLFLVGVIYLFVALPLSAGAPAERATRAAIKRKGFVDSQRPSR